MSILFTMVRFPPTACIETYSIRAALEREWSYNLEMSLTDQELCQLSYMLYQRKLVHRMILKTRFFHWGRVNSNHRKTHFLSFSTLIPRIHCLIRHIICIFYVWTHSNLNFGPISFFHQSCTLKLKIMVWCSGGCRISNRTRTQPFLIRLSLNLAWLLRRCKQSSLDTKQWPCGTAVFHTVHAEFLSAKHSAIS